VSRDDEMMKELSQTMTSALLKLKVLVDRDASEKHDFLSVAKVFLIGIVSTAVDLIEVTLPGSAPFIYADIEAVAKQGGLRSIKKMQSVNDTIHYSVSGIASDDMTTAMNYMGQELSTALFKGLHELPLPLRNQEMLLRGVEALLANLLRHKFDNPHQILDNFCDHVHMALADLESRMKH
jgi:hypothetical protein